MKFNGKTLEQVYSQPFKGQEYPDEYMQYLRREKGIVVDVVRKKMMVGWTNSVMFSAGFSVCFPVIALAPVLGGQMVHYSRDPWFPTDYDEFIAMAGIWKHQRAQVVLMHATETSAYSGDLELLTKYFGDSFAVVDFKVNSRFEVVVDVRERQILVLLTDARMLNIYQM